MVFSRKHSFYYSFIYLKCIFGCTGLLHGLSLVEAGEDSSQAAVFKLLTVVVLLSPSTVSKCMGFSTCSTWAPGGMWNPPRPGIEPMSPALAGRFLTTAPLEKSQEASVLKDDISISKSNKFDKLWQKQSSTSYLAGLLKAKHSQVF